MTDACNGANDPGPASDAPAPPMTVWRRDGETIEEFERRRAASPAQEATPPREQEQHQGWTKNDQQQEPKPSRDATVRDG